MKKVRLLQIEFENEIAAYEIPAFRGAIVKISGMENTLFHNHKNDKLLYKYPLIQYKRNNKKPMIVCIEEGVDEVHHFFEKKQIGILLGERQYELKIAKLNMNQFTMQVWDKSFRYYLRNWLALNQKNYNDYNKIANEIEQIEFLEKILTGNILSFAKGINWQLEKQIKLRISEISDKKIIKIKNTQRDAFSLVFTSNVFLPNYIGLGKNASLGFGVVKQINKNNEHGKS